jgi:hypothetical protein
MVLDPYSRLIARECTMLDEILGMAFGLARNEGDAYLVASAGFAGKSIVALLCVRGLVEGRDCRRLRGTRICL